MSTIRATNIQPQSDSDPLVFSTNATEKLRIPSTGAISITGGAVVGGGLSVTGGAALSGGLSVTGNVSTSGNLTLGSATLSTPSGNAPLYGARAWAVLKSGGSSNSPTLLAGGNIASATRVTSSEVSITFSTPMPSANYAVFILGDNDPNDGLGIHGYYRVIRDSKTTTGFRYRSLVDIGSDTNYSYVQDYLQIDIVVFA